MKQDIAILWADALESGNYIQGKNALNQNNSFCCLGVLADIASDLGIVSKGDDGCGRTTYDNEIFALTEIVKEWAGINSVSGDVFTADHNSLINMNDGEGCTFNEIAAVIRKDYEIM